MNITYSTRALVAACVFLGAACNQISEETIDSKEVAVESADAVGAGANEDGGDLNAPPSEEGAASGAMPLDKRIADGELSVANYLLDSGGMNIERADGLLGSSHFGQMLSALSRDPKRSEKASSDQNLLDQAIKESLKVSELKFGEVRSSCSDDVCMLSVGTREDASAIENWSNRLSKTTAGLGDAAFQSQITLPNGVTEFRMILSTNQSTQGVTFGQKGVPSTFTVGGSGG